jgi:hypothetical protein
LSLRDVWKVEEFESDSIFQALVVQIRKRLPSLERFETPLLFANNASAVFGSENRDRADFAIGLSFLKGGDLISGERVLSRIAERDPPRESPTLLVGRGELLDRVQEVLGETHIERRR